MQARNLLTSLPGFRSWLCHSPAEKSWINCSATKKKKKISSLYSHCCYYFHGFSSTLLAGRLASGRSRRCSQALKTEAPPSHCSSRSSPNPALRWYMGRSQMVTFAQKTASIVRQGDKVPVTLPREEGETFN